MVRGSEAVTSTGELTASAGHPAVTPTRASRFLQIDILKGLAMVGVMAQHAFTSSALRDSWETLYAGQAVPVFFILMGLNASRSLDRRPRRTLRGLYTRAYLLGRLNRLGIPFVLIWLVAAVSGLAAGEFHVGGLVLVGVLPLTKAPGNYFVTILAEFAVFFPLGYWCFVRSPLATSVVLYALGVGFDLAAAHVSFLNGSGTREYIYEAAILKYSGALVAGVWLARLEVTNRLLAALAPLALGSLLYLVLLHQRPQDFTWLRMSFSESTNFISVFYAVFLTCLGLRYLPARSGRLGPRLMARLGRASYHIFLVQIVWFGLVGDRSAVAGICGILACSMLGWLYFEALERFSLMDAPSGLSSPRIGRRRAG